MRNANNRKANALVILSAAAGISASLVQTSFGQTWVAPNNGNWSVGANWTGGVAPAAGASTNLVFNASGAQSYTATNNIANPFLLNSLSFNNSGTGSIALAGSQLSFASATPSITNNGSGRVAIGNPLNFVNTTSITGTGAGTLFLSGALSGTAQSGDTPGAALEVNNANANVDLSGATGSIYALRVNNGNAFMGSGSLNFTSTQRGNDPTAGINDAGSWALVVGSGAAQTGRFTMTGGNLTATSGYLANTAGSSGIATFTGASTNANFGAGRFGVNFGDGTINILNGAQVTANLFHAGRQDSANGTFNISGANTLVTVNTEMDTPLGAGTSRAFVNLSAGARIQNNGNFFTSSGPQTSGTFNVNGANWNTVGVSVFSGGGGTDGGFSQLNLSGAATFSSGTLALGQDGGPTGNVGVTVTGGSTLSSVNRVVLAGGPNSFTDVTVTGSRFLNSGVIIMSGGFADQVGESIPGGDATITLNNSTLTAGSAIIAGSNPNGGISRIIANASNINAGTSDIAFGSDIGVRAAGTFTNGTTVTGGRGLFMATDDQSSASLTVSGNTTTATFALSVVQSGGSQTALGDPLPGGTSTLTINTGAKVTAQNGIFASGLTSQSTTNVDGAGSQFTVTAGAGTSLLDIGSTGGASATFSLSNAAALSISGGTAQLVVGDEGAGTLNISSGATASVGQAMFVGANPGSTGNVTVNAGTLTASQLQVGGSGGDDGGAAVVNISNNGFVSANTGSTSLIAVFQPGTINIGSGTSKGTLVAGQTGMGVDGTVNFNAGTMTVLGELDVAGNVLLSSAARTGTGAPTNKKFIEVGSATLTSSGVIDLNDNDMLIHDTSTGAKQKYENFVRTARNNGAWNQPGITSTAAKNSAPANKNLGVISGAEFQSANGGAGATFNGKTVAGTDTLIKFTFNGDTDLNGVVNFDDYARTDSGFNNGRSGWFNGDFDYNGQVNFDDYGAIDLAFNTQSGVVLSLGNGPAGPAADRTIVSAIAGMDHLTGMTGGPTDGSLFMAPKPENDQLLMSGANQIGGGQLQAVPEPASIGLIGLGMLGALRRRRRAVR